MAQRQVDGVASIAEQVGQAVVDEIDTQSTQLADLFLLAPQVLLSETARKIQGRESLGKYQLQIISPPTRVTAMLEGLLSFGSQLPLKSAGTGDS